MVENGKMGASLGFPLYYTLCNLSVIAEFHLLGVLLEPSHFRHHTPLACLMCITRTVPCAYLSEKLTRPRDEKGMSTTNTLEFVLGCYDFDGSGRLTIDEITLAFKSTVTGLCKLEGAASIKCCPRDTEFETAAMDAFERRAGPDRFKVKVRSSH